MEEAEADAGKAAVPIGTATTVGGVEVDRRDARSGMGPGATADANEAAGAPYGAPTKEEAAVETNGAGAKVAAGAVGTAHGT